MRIEQVSYICPKCKKIYHNYGMMSYYGGMASAAKNFSENNKSITHCTECNLKLVREYLKDRFDENGEYISKCKQIEFTEMAIEDFASELNGQIMSFKECFENAETSFGYLVEIERGKIIEENSKRYIVFSNETKECNSFEEVKLNGFVLLKGCNDEKEYELLKVEICNSYNYIGGTRYNNFKLQYLLNIMAATMKSILEFISSEKREKLQITDLGWLNEYEFLSEALRIGICNGEAIKKDLLDAKLCELIVLRNPSMLKNLPEELISSKTCINALANNEFECLHAIENIPEKFWTEELAEVVFNNVKKYAGFLSLIPEVYRTENRCLVALVEGGDFNISYVPEKFQTEEFYIKVLKQCPHLLKWIPEKFDKEELMKKI